MRIVGNLLCRYGGLGRPAGGTRQHKQHDQNEQQDDALLALHVPIPKNKAVQNFQRAIPTRLRKATAVLKARCKNLSDGLVRTPSQLM
jgi:hypothetical protein